MIDRAIKALFMRSGILGDQSDDWHAGARELLNFVIGQRGTLIERALTEKTLFDGASSD